MVSVAKIVVAQAQRASGIGCQLKNMVVLNEAAALFEGKRSLPPHRESEFRRVTLSPDFRTGCSSSRTPNVSGWEQFLKIPAPEV